MTIRNITTDEARAILANDEAESLPFQFINQDGRDQVSAFVAASAKEPARHNLIAWFDEAETAAGNASVGESIIIEMRGQMTTDGNPRTLTLSADCFDWCIND